MTIIDKSNYLKGLLILARKNKKLVENEKKIIREAAKRMGFSKDFYEETLRNLLNNKYILEVPIKFSDQEVAKMFISEGIELALSDNEICENEMNWLRLIAKENSIPNEWMNQALSNFSFA